MRESITATTASRKAVTASRLSVLGIMRSVPRLNGLATGRRRPISGLGHPSSWTVASRARAAKFVWHTWPARSADSFCLNALYPRFFVRRFFFASTRTRSAIPCSLLRGSAPFVFQRGWGFETWPLLSA